MVVVTASEQTIRCMIKKFRVKIHYTDYKMDPFDTVSDAGMAEKGKLAMDSLNISSGNEQVVFFAPTS